MRTTNNVLDITAQRSTISGDGKSRNSIRPLFEEAGFDMKYDDPRKQLTILDGGEEMATISGVKGVQGLGLVSRKLLSPVYISGSDVWDEAFYIKNKFTQILSLGIGDCSLRMLTTDDQTEFDQEKYQYIYTKYPRLCMEAFYKYYPKEYELYRQDWPDSKPWEVQSAEGLFNRIETKIRYDESPDTTTADMKCAFPEEDFAAWELVETGSSMKALSLKDFEIPALRRNVSTNIYARPLKENSIQQQQLDVIVSRIQAIL